jgi:hypothetical protein
MDQYRAAQPVSALDNESYSSICGCICQQTAMDLAYFAIGDSLNPQRFPKGFHRVRHAWQVLRLPFCVLLWYNIHIISAGGWFGRHPARTSAAVFVSGAQQTKRAED